MPPIQDRPQARSDGAARAPDRPALTDEELDAYISARLRGLGIDLTVLPENDPDAPADVNRIMASARRFLRATPPAIADLELDALGPPPALYPAEGIAWRGDGPAPGN